MWYLNRLWLMSDAEVKEKRGGASFKAFKNTAMAAYKLSLRLEPELRALGKMGDHDSVTDDLNRAIMSAKYKRLMSALASGGLDNEVTHRTRTHFFLLLLNVVIVADHEAG